MDSIKSVPPSSISKASISIHPATLISQFYTLHLILRLLRVELVEIII